MSTGWTANQVLDEMTWPLWQAFHDEWTERPPVHWLVAGALDYQPPASAKFGARSSTDSYMTIEAAREWQRRTGGMIPGVAPLGLGKVS
jgi:hypothetical protein